MDRLPSEIVLEVLLYCSITDIEHFAHSSKTHTKLLDEQLFYNRLFKRAFCTANYFFIDEKVRIKNNVESVGFHTLLHAITRLPAYMRPPRGEMIVGYRNGTHDLPYDMNRGYTKFKYGGTLLGDDRAIRCNKPFRTDAAQLGMYKTQDNYRVCLHSGGYFEMTIEKPEHPA